MTQMSEHIPTQNVSFMWKMANKALLLLFPVLFVILYSRAFLLPERTEWSVLSVEWTFHCWTLFQGEPLAVLDVDDADRCNINDLPDPDKYYGPAASDDDDGSSDDGGSSDHDGSSEEDMSESGGDEESDSEEEEDDREGDSDDDDRYSCIHSCNYLTCLNNPFL